MGLPAFSLLLETLELKSLLAKGKSRTYRTRKPVGPGLFIRRSQTKVSSNSIGLTSSSLSKDAVKAGAGREKR